jgi:hypothetical protein
MFRNEVGLRMSRGLSADDLAMEAGGAANLERARAGRLSAHNMFENQKENELENRRPQAGRGGLGRSHLKPFLDYNSHLFKATVAVSPLFSPLQHHSNLLTTTTTTSPSFISSPSLLPLPPQYRPNSSAAP